MLSPDGARTAAASRVARRLLVDDRFGGCMRQLYAARRFCGTTPAGFLEEVEQRLVEQFCTISGHAVAGAGDDHMLRMANAVDQQALHVVRDGAVVLAGDDQGRRL